MSGKVLRSDVYDVSNLIIDEDMSPEDIGEFFASVALTVFKDKYPKPTQANLEEFAKVFRVPLKRVNEELQRRYYDK